MLQALHPRVVAAALLVLAIHLAAWTLASSSVPPVIHGGLAIDLTATSALLVYVLAVRPGLLPPLVLVPVVVAGAAVARWVLPATPVTAAVGAAVGVLELILMAALLRRVARLARRARRRGDTVALLDVLEDGVHQLGLPRRAAAIAAAEVAIVTYAIAGWRRPRADPHRFTVHRAKGWSLYAGVFIALSLVEAAGLHLVLASRAPVIAWILTALSVYGVLWLLGDALALRHTGVRISDAGLRVDVGVRWRADIPWPSVERLERVDARPPKAMDTVDASILEPTIAVHLREPVVVRGPFGIVRPARRVFLTVDDVDRFERLAASTPRVAPSPDEPHVGAPGPA